MDAERIIREWTGSDTEPLFVVRLRAFLTTEQVARVLETLDGICTSCWDSDRGCQCWNDE